MNLNPGFFSRKLRTGPPLAVRLGADIGFVNLADVLAFRFKSGKTFAFLADGEVQTLKSFAKIQAYLKKLDGWFPCGRCYLVNLYRLRRSERIPGKSGFQLTLDNGVKVPLIAEYAKPILNFLGEESLIYIAPLALPFYRLMLLGVKEITKNILFMTKEELQANFSTASGSAVVVSVLMANFLWQQVNYIRAGSPSPVEGGNVRSLWYLVKPVLSRLDILDETDHYKTLSEKLGEMVSNKILSYHEFDLLEDGKWKVGAYNPHVILMAEKESHFRFLQQMQDLTGSSIVATGGQPSTITSEYFTDDLKTKLQNIGNTDQITVLSLTDYDPFGWALLDTFMGDLKTFGIKTSQVINLSVPKNYKPEELEMLHYDIEKSGDTPPVMLRKWMKLTNGIDGKPWGMEVDVLMTDKNRVKNLILEAGKPFFKVPPPVPTKLWRETEKLFIALSKDALKTLKKQKP
ncbi:MAG TPA: LytTR family transcriptional regulator DNA-binding domain-containing protein [Verrucomicrobiota bacterium]|nr:LytTR family transcriptional regulator DNA-binding domain-containing protein [Verrucomicrobiota bacterium]